MPRSNDRGTDELETKENKKKTPPENALLQATLTNRLISNQAFLASGLLSTDRIQIFVYYHH